MNPAPETMNRNLCRVDSEGPGLEVVGSWFHGSGCFELELGLGVLSPEKVSAAAVEHSLSYPI